MLPRFRQLLRGLDDVSFLDPERLNELLSDDEAEPTLDETIDVVVRAKANGHWVITGVGPQKLQPGLDPHTAGIQVGWARKEQHIEDSVRIELARQALGKGIDSATLKEVEARVLERVKPKPAEDVKELKGKGKPPKKAD